MYEAHMGDPLFTVLLLLFNFVLHARLLRRVAGFSTY